MTAAAPEVDDARLHSALAAVQRTLARYRTSPPREQEAFRRDLDQLEAVAQKLTSGTLEIAVFGEISTGKSALINALAGREVASVDVRGGWTREVSRTAWDPARYRLPGLGTSQVLLVDTPGLNEIGGAERAELARETAEQADLVLFVTDSDLNEIEHAALSEIVRLHKPVLLVLNKLDLYSPRERERLLEVLRLERARDLLPPEDVLAVAAAPREVEYVIEAADGSTRTEWRRPQPQIQELEDRVLELLERDGLALLALNAALFSADRSDRLAAKRVQLRGAWADRVVWSYAGAKALAVALNPVPGVDIASGLALDAAMVVTLSRIYGLPLTWRQAQGLVWAVAKSTGLVLAGEAATHAAAWAFTALTVGWGKVVTAVPQGAAAGYTSYLVGQAARRYFEHGAAWGAGGPKAVVRELLRDIDKQSVLARLADEIRGKLGKNPHAAG